MMVHSNVKYQRCHMPHDESEESETRKTCKHLKICSYLRGVHWSIKLLISVFMLMQTFSYVGHYNESERFYRYKKKSWTNINGGLPSAKSINEQTSDIDKEYLMWQFTTQTATSDDYGIYDDLATNTMQEPEGSTATFATSQKSIRTPYMRMEKAKEAKFRKISTTNKNTEILNLTTSDWNTPIEMDVTDVTDITDITDITDVTDTTHATDAIDITNAMDVTHAIHLTRTTRTLEHIHTTSTKSYHKINSTIQMPDKRPYFINTSTCHIPYIDPFSPEARKIFKPSHQTGCTRDDAIVSVSHDDIKSQYILHINHTVAMTISQNSNESYVRADLQCCYRQIVRSGSGARADREFTLLPCTNFHQDFFVPCHIQGVIIDCSSKSQKKLLQQDAFAFIQVNHTKDNEQNGRSWNTLTANGPQNLGVLLIGIDALSRINLRRNMPQVVKHLQGNGWYELRGYNKVGDNTLPNLAPLLLGLTKKTTISKCKPTSVGGLDKCDFIWRKFSEHGPKTAYAEDTTIISTFNFNLKGFLKPPTDHYFRPIALAVEKKMKKTKKASLNYCIGRKQAGEYVYDYALEFATRYRNQSNFGLFWTNSFSHNSFLTASTMDARMVEYFKEFKLKGILEQSVVIFFSDHGQRWGPLLKLSEGFMEERLPFMFISLPAWLKKKYPAYVQSLEVNQERLITPFDIYMTLQDLLHVAAPEYKVAQAEDCSNAQSIFQVIPENRTCLDACIPDAWCTCSPYMIVSNKNAVVRRVTGLILDEMNRYFVARNMTSLCSKLTIKSILGARKHEKEITTLGRSSTYVIEFVTNPRTNPVAVFSATANYDHSLDKIQLDVDGITRHSKYEKTAKCTNDKQAKKYCICRDSLVKA